MLSEIGLSEQEMEPLHKGYEDIESENDNDSPSIDRMIQSLIFTSYSSGADVPMKDIVLVMKFLTVKWLQSPCLPEDCTENTITVLSLINKFDVELDHDNIIEKTCHENFAGSSSPRNAPQADKKKLKIISLPNNQTVPEVKLQERIIGIESIKYGTLSQEYQVLVKIKSLLTLYLNHIFGEQKDLITGLIRTTESIQLVMEHIRQAICHLSHAKKLQNERKNTIKMMKNIDPKIFDIDQMNQSTDNFTDEDDLDNEDDDCNLIDLEELNKTGSQSFGGVPTKLTNMFTHSNLRKDKQAALMKYLLDIAKMKELRIDGDQIMQRKKVYQCFVLAEQGQLMCGHVDGDGHSCNCLELEHGFNISARTDHAFVCRTCYDKSMQYTTCAWESIGEIGEWIASLMDPDLNNDLFFNSLGNQISQLKNRLMLGVSGSYLPKLDRDKSAQKYGPAFSFKNGIWFMNTCTFMDYEDLKNELDDGSYHDLISLYKDEFFNYERYMKQLKGNYNPSLTDRSPRVRYQNYIKNNVCSACKRPQCYHKKQCSNAHFNMVRCLDCGLTFDDDEHLANQTCKCSSNGPSFYKIDIAKATMDVKTPFFDSILDNQFNNPKKPFNDYKTVEGILYWFYALMGFFINPRNKDHANYGWQIMTMIIGLAGTGKSLMLEILEAFIPVTKKGILNSNSQETFGLSNLIDDNGKIQKKCFIYELSANMKIPYTQIQSMACGESVAINIKNHNSAILTWLEKLIAAGNVLPGWDDKGGALIRRIVLFNFLFQVKDTDSFLKQRIINRELGALLFKISYFYKDATKKFGGKSRLDKKTNLACRHRDCVNGRFILPPSMRNWHKDMRNSFSPFFDMIDRHLETKYGEVSMFLDTRPLLKNENENENENIFKTTDKDGNIVARAYVPLEDIRTKYNSYMTKCHPTRKRSPLDANMMAPILDHFNLTLVGKELEWEGTKTNQQYIIGIGSSSESQAARDDVKHQEDTRRASLSSRTEDESEFDQDNQTNEADIINSKVDQIHSYFKDIYDVGELKTAWKVIKQVVQNLDQKSDALPTDIVEIFKHLCSMNNSSNGNESNERRERTQINVKDDDDEESEHLSSLSDDDDLYANMPPRMSQRKCRRLSSYREPSTSSLPNEKRTRMYDSNCFNDPFCQQMMGLTPATQPTQTNVY